MHDVNIIKSIRYFVKLGIGSLMHVEVKKIIGKYKATYCHIIKVCKLSSDGVGALEATLALFSYI